MKTKTVAKKQPVVLPPQYEVSSTSSSQPQSLRWKLMIAGLVVLLVGLFAANKGWIVAAVVNGRPIFSWELNATLRSRYGQQTLEGLIGEALISQEAQKANVAVTEKEIEAKQAAVLASLGSDIKIDDFLKFQGLTKTDFQHQLAVQLIVEKLLTKGLTITDEQIDAYIATNGATLSATEPAKLCEEAKAMILNSIVSEKLQTWYGQIREKASIAKFL